MVKVNGWKDVFHDLKSSGILFLHIYNSFIILFDFFDSSLFHGISCLKLFLCKPVFW